jgi:hypothetical protein
MVNLDPVFVQHDENVLQIDLARMVLEERTENPLDLGNVATTIRQIEIDNPLANAARHGMRLRKVVVERDDDTAGVPGQTGHFMVGYLA